MAKPIDDAARKRIVELAAQRCSRKAIAERLGMTERTVYRVISKAGTGYGKPGRPPKR